MQGSCRLRSSLSNFFYMYLWWNFPWQSTVELLSIFLKCSTFSIKNAHLLQELYSVNLFSSKRQKHHFLRKSKDIFGKKSLSNLNHRSFTNTLMSSVSLHLLYWQSSLVFCINNSTSTQQKKVGYNLYELPEYQESNLFLVLLIHEVAISRSD